MASALDVLSSPVLPAIGTAAVFVGVVTLVTSLALATRPRTGVARSLATVAAMRAAAPTARENDLQAPFVQRVLDPLLEAAVRLGRRLTPREQVIRIRRKLDLAGNPPGWDLDRVLLLKVLLTALGVSLSLTVCLAADVTRLQTLAAVAVLGTLAWFAPSMIVYQMAYDRSARILRDLPDALDLLTISVESGLGFDAAVSQVARNTRGPLAQELSRVLQEMQIGTGRVDALRGLGVRSDVDDLQSFVAAMVQADAYGVPIAAVLRVQADEMRSKRSQRAEEAAQRVPIKILFPLVFGILPALFVVVIGPAAVAAFLSFRGL